MSTIGTTALPATAWFRDARFGMFIHWGLYSRWGRGEWVMHRENLPAAAYNPLADEFKPAAFDADAWADLARRAGAKYMVLTTRHHDGFCLFDSAASDFTSVKTAARRDFVAEYVDACRRAGLKVGLYYSLANWQSAGYHAGPDRDPAGFETLVRQIHDQVRELLTHYGKIDLLWYDGGHIPTQDEKLMAKNWRAKELNAMARRLQPGLLINDRSGLPEDFSTPEQHVHPPKAGRLWEACMTIGSGWGYIKDDKEIKTVPVLLRQLVTAARFGGNLLLNVGPREDGTIQPEFVARLEAMGRWLQTNGEAIYGSQRSAVTEADHVAGLATAANRRLYFHLFDWPGDTVRLVGLRGGLQSVKLLGSPAPVVAITEPGGAVLVQNLVQPGADNPVPVLALELTAPSGAGRLPGILTAHDTGHYDPAEAPVLTGPELLPLVAAGAGAKLKASTAWCPAWQQAPVLSLTADKIDLLLPANLPGRYCLELGLIVSAPATVSGTLAGIELPVSKLRTGGYPDLFRFPVQALAGGRQGLTLTVKPGIRLGVYGARLCPVWRPLPAELWRSIGPFPTAWNAHAPAGEVRNALATVFPPEQEFQPTAVYVGTDGIQVGWRHSRLRRGAQAARGVNFVFRCGTRHSGVCYARTVIHAPDAREADLLIGCDWWAKAFINGEAVRSSRDPAKVDADGAAFNTWKPTPARIHLRKGDNVLLVKGHPGSMANWFSCFISDPGDLRIGIG